MVGSGGGGPAAREPELLTHEHNGTGSWNQDYDDGYDDWHSGEQTRPSPQSKNTRKELV